MTSERINSLSPNAELFYRRLMSVVDDYGRFSANLTLLRASCYPLKLDSVKEDSISKHLAECVGARLIVLYTVSGKAYLEMQDFNQRVQSKSKYPEPSDMNVQEAVIHPSSSLTNRGQRAKTGSHGDPPLKTALDEVVVEDEIEDEEERNNGAAAPRLDYRVMFTQLWDSWPIGLGEKGSRKNAEAAFLKLKPDATAFASMLRAVDLQAADKSAKAVADQFWAPFQHVERWIRNQRWNDEITSTVTSISRPDASDFTQRHSGRGWADA